MGATMMAAPTSNVAALVGPFFKDSPVLRDKRPIPRSYTMSALPPKADIVQDGRDVRFVPKEQGFATCEMGFRGQFAQQQSWAAHVRFGSKADIEASPPDVCFTSESGHRLSEGACPLCAKSGRSKLFDHLIGGDEKIRRDFETKAFGSER